MILWSRGLARSLDMLNNYISTTTVPKATKLGRLVINVEGLLPTMLVKPLVMWSCEIMYWLPEIRKTPRGCYFIVASKQCSHKQLFKAMYHIFKMINSHVESFHKKIWFHSNLKQFWLVQNYFLIFEKLTKSNQWKNAKTMSTFDFSTLYTTIPHTRLIKVLNDIISFVVIKK